MTIIIGLFIVFACVFGGFVLSKGQLLSLWQPYELLIIGGAALGAFIAANPFRVVIKSLTMFWNVLRGSRYNKSTYMSLFGLLYEIGQKIRKSGLMSIEQEIDYPDESDLFAKYPEILKDPRAVEFLCDNLRVIISSNLTPYEFEALLDYEIDTHGEELDKPVHAVTWISEAMPGFGIVAAVMGIVITMQFLGGDPKFLGFKVAAALVGTFLGVLLCYGVVGPISSAMGHLRRKELKYYECMKIFLVAMLAGSPPQISIEYARRSLYSEVRPNFLELEQFVRSISKKKKSDGAGGS